MIASLAVVVSAAAWGYAAQNDRPARREPAPRPSIVAAPAYRPFLMPVEDVFFIAGRGAVVTGKIEFGLVRVGDPVEIVGLGETLRTRVTGVEMFRKVLNEGRTGDNVGIMLSGVTRRQLQRGQVLAKPGSIDTCDHFDAMVTPLPRGQSGMADFRFRTVDLGGRITSSEREGQRWQDGGADSISGLIALSRGDAFRNSPRRPNDRLRHRDPLPVRNAVGEAPDKARSRRSMRARSRPGIGSRRS